MCGRLIQLKLALTIPGFDEPLEPDFDEWPPDRYNICPTERIVILSNDDPHKYKIARFGLIPSWSKEGLKHKPLINARSETVGELPSFKSSVRSRRAILPVPAFYEWPDPATRTSSIHEIPDKQPMKIQLRSQGIIPIAGIWEDSTDKLTNTTYRSFSIVTTGANQMMAKIHDRMPVILPSKAIKHWLSPDKMEMPELNEFFRQYPNSEMEMVPVNPAVSRGGRGHPEGAYLAEPIGPAIQVN